MDILEKGISEKGKFPTEIFISNIPISNMFILYLWIYRKSDMDILEIGYSHRTKIHIFLNSDMSRPICPFLAMDYRKWTYWK
jgi:hypothetical protein